MKTVTRSPALGFAERGLAQHDGVALVGGEFSPATRSSAWARGGRAVSGDASREARGRRVGDGWIQNNSGDARTRARGGALGGTRLEEASSRRFEAPAGKAPCVARRGR